MAKLDEIAELLTEEIHTFQKAVDRLENLQTALKEYKLEPDVSLVNQMLQEYHNSQVNQHEKLRNLIQDLIRAIQTSKIIPTWQVKLLWVWSSLNLIAWGITVAFLTVQIIYRSP